MLLMKTFAVHNVFFATGKVTSPRLAAGKSILVGMIPKHRVDLCVFNLFL